MQRSISNESDGKAGDTNDQSVAPGFVFKVILTGDSGITHFRLSMILITNVLSSKGSVKPPFLNDCSGASSSRTTKLQSDLNFLRILCRLTQKLKLSYRYGTQYILTAINL